MKRFFILLTLLATAAQAQILVTLKKGGRPTPYASVKVDGLTLKLKKKGERFEQKINKRNIQYVSMPKPKELSAIEKAYYSNDHATVVKLAQPFVDKYKYLGWGKAVVPYYVDSLIATKAESKEIVYQAQAAIGYMNRDRRSEVLETVKVKIAQSKAKSVKEGYNVAIESLIEVELPSKSVASHYYIALGDLYLGQGKKQQAAVQYMKVVVVGKDVGSSQWTLAYKKAEALYKEINPSKVKELKAFLKVKKSE